MLERMSMGWFGHGIDRSGLATAGFRPSGGGVHQSKTMMLRELNRILDALSGTDASPSALVIDANILGKATSSARQLALERLRALHGIGLEFPVSRMLAAIWRLDPTGRPLLALLSALARDPLLRDSADVVMPAAIGTPVRWPLIASRFASRHPGRFSPKIHKSLSQNCASSWTQSGHLKGEVR
jgi:hypothetical protein